MPKLGGFVPGIDRRHFAFPLAHLNIRRRSDVTVSELRGGLIERQGVGVTVNIDFFTLDILRGVPSTVVNHHNTRHHTIGDVSTSEDLTVAARDQHDIAIFDLTILASAGLIQHGSRP